MIKTIAAATLLGALATYLFFSSHVDAPDDSLQPVPTTVQAPLTTTQPELPGRISEFDDGTEQVLGIRVRKDRNCRVELKDYVTPHGEMFAAYSCTPHEPQIPQGYEHYDDATLAAMAYADAEASALLGRKLIGTDTRKAYQLLLRASALDDGNVEHIAWLADQAFGTVAINGEPQLANLMRQYELAVLAARLGDLSGKANYFKNELIKTGADRVRLGALERRADELVRSMRDIQQTVLGEVTIGEQGDA